MGNQSSRHTDEVAVGISEYEKICLMDPEVKHFSDNLKYRTDKIFQAVVSDPDERGLSFQSLKEVTASFLEVDEQVTNVILNYKKDIWANSCLFDLVQEYFDHSLATMDFCAELDKCIKQARENQMLVQVAVNLVPNSDELPSESQCGRILKELQGFVEAGDPFTDEFLKRFEAVYLKQIDLQQKLYAKKKKFDRRLRLVNAWNKVSTIILAATCAAVIVFSIVAAVLALPGFATAVSLITALPLESASVWIKSMWAKYQSQIEHQHSVIMEANQRTFVVIKELDTIKALVSSLKTEIASTMHCIEFGEERKEAMAVKLVVERLRKKQGTFLRDLEELEEHVERCSKCVRTARAVVLRRIVKKRSLSF